MQSEPYTNMPVTATSTLYSSAIAKNANTGAGFGGLGPNGQVTADTIRLFLRDQPELNILNDLEIEFDTVVLEQGIMAACSSFNTTTPIGHTVKFDGSDWPKQAPHLLIIGAAAWVLRTNVAQQIRNQLNAQDGNIPRVGIHDKYQEFLQYSETLRADFRDEVSRLKKSLDFESSYDSLSSPLVHRGGWYGY